jgi:hypothetical protein
MIGIQENKITKVPLLEAVAQTQAVAAAIEAKDFEKAMSFRDPEFQEILQAFKISSSLSPMERVPENKVRLAMSFSRVLTTVALANRYHSVSPTSASIGHILTRQRWSTCRRDECCHSSGRPILPRSWTYSPCRP